MKKTTLKSRMKKNELYVVYTDADRTNDGSHTAMARHESMPRTHSTTASMLTLQSALHGSQHTSISGVAKGRSWFRFPCSSNLRPVYVVGRRVSGK